MQKLPKLISKTKLLRGYRCPLCIYLTIHQPKLEAPVTPALQSLFDQGHFVGTKAREYFPNGVLVDHLPWDFVGALEKTRNLLNQKTSLIYEGAFAFKGCYARVDILKYSQDTERWQLFEVKSTTKVKPEHLDDLALQAWILAQSGLPLEKICIVHLNNECRYPHLNDLFTIEDVTPIMREKYPAVAQQLNKIFAVIQEDTAPKMGIGPHCEEPNDCGFKAHCWTENKVGDFSLLSFKSLGKEKWRFWQNGLAHIHDPLFPDFLKKWETPEMGTSIKAEKLRPLMRAIEVKKSGQRWIQKEKLYESLCTWKFPLVFLDFETMNPAIPVFDGCGPFSAVPFQLSVHCLTDLNSEPQHWEYLHDQDSDPRPSLIPILLKACKGEGSVVAYYGKFESDRIEELADFDPIHREALLAIKARIVDPLPLIKDFVYDEKFYGSYSLKKVAPALLGEEHSYQGLLVSDGTEAQRTYEQILRKDIEEEKRKLLKNGLLEYCKKDTLVLVELVRWLYNNSKQF